MNILLRVPLNTDAEQSARLMQLQAVFAQACNALAPLVQKTGVWNRVALHHMAYKALREQFPQLGSQMVCNAIYSVSRHCRVMFQHPQSPFHLSKLTGKSLPRLRFLDSCPVYFDRHTLSLKERQLSMYTLDGRMRFQLDLNVDDVRNFHEMKLREIALTRGEDGSFQLVFVLGEGDDEVTPTENNNGALMPDYVNLEEMNEPA